MSAYDGLRVVDFSQGVSGPMAAMQLGDFGAEVIKVEPPGGDRLKDHPGYLAYNRNKQILTLDRSKPEGRQAALRLIAGADVAIFDDAPGGLEPLGMDAANLTAAHPALVHLWTPPYGVAGCWSGIAPDPLLLTGLSGISFRQGAFSDQPVHLVLPLTSYAQGVLGAAAVGAALYERSRSGRGQGVVVSGLQAAAEIAPMVRIAGVDAIPRGTPPGSNPRYRLYRCADGEWFFLGTLFTNFYRKAFQAIGLEDAFEAMEIDMLGARDLLSAIFETRPRDEWLEILRENDVPCAPVGPREAWFASECVGEGGLRQSFSHPKLGPVAMPGPAARLSATPATIRALPTPIAEAPDWPARASPSGVARPGGPWPEPASSISAP